MSEPQVIPTSPYPEGKFSINLDGSVYDSRIYWLQYDDQINEVVGDDNEGKWFMDLVGRNNEVNVKGMALVCGCDILEPYAYSELGSILVLDTQGLGADPNFEGMGSRFEVRYLPKAINEQILTEIGYL